MLNYKKLIENIKDDDKITDYLTDFFKKTNFKEYELDENISPDQKKAIKVMFESKKKIADRAEDAFRYDPFCKEAIFVYMVCHDDIYVQLRFNTYLSELDKYPALDNYQKQCYIAMLNLFIEFLLDIDNVTGAIKIQKLLIQLTNETTSSDISRLAFMYFSNELADEFYRLYLDYDLDLYSYLLLIATLLKHDEESKAEEVLNDMYDHHKYSIYLDHVWDLDQNDPEQKKVMVIVDSCYEDLRCMPNFFSWVNRTREKYGK